MSRRTTSRTDLAIWLLVMSERLALSTMPRGPFRKRVLARIDSTLARMHREKRGNCGRKLT
jgi:hypothetical protein